MNHLSISFSLFAAILTLTFSTDVSAQEISEKKLRERVIWQNELFPQEKVHITTDKEIYLSGDTVWMRPFLVDAMTCSPVSRSRFMYVDLVSEQDSIKQRVKLHRNPEENDSIMQGYLPLDITLPTGIYTIVAYTQWMINTSEHYFFKKNISVINPKEVLDNEISTVKIPYNGADAWHYADIETAFEDTESMLTGTARITTDKPSYTPRQKATVRIEAPAKTSLAVSVTDNGFNTQPRHSLIASSMSIPYIHNLDELAKGNIRLPNIPFEDAEIISGKVVSLVLGRPLANVNIGLIAPQHGLADIAVTDIDGNFTFNDLDLPNGTVFCIRSYNNKQKSQGYIEFPKSYLPNHLHHLAAPASSDNISELTTDVNFVQNLRKRMEYNHGMWQMLLNEVEVVTSYKKKVKESDAIKYVKRFDSDYIREKNITTIDELLMRIPGVRTSVDNAFYRQAVLQFVIDNVMVEPFTGMSPYQAFLQMCPFEWIESVELLNAVQSLMYTPSTATVGMRTFNEKSATIRVKTKSIAETSTYKDHYILKPLGYQPRIDYKPQTYDKPGTIDNSDQRSTLYWNPALRTDDDGTAMFEFYTNDASGTTLTIAIEGISDDGLIISHTKQITIE
ncbi:MAG: hypothetical protein KBT20_05320 [Bacteroidales bacterium]|nr:hypothetical protein [Candidatus Liminaster caballi]